MDSPQIRKQAQHWVVEMADANVTPKVVEAFEDWRIQSAYHSEVYSEVESLFYGLADVEGLAALEPLGQVMPGAQRAEVKSYLVRLREKWAAPHWAAAATAAVTLVALLVFKPFDSSQEALQFSTAIAEIRDITLADGSVVTMGGRSKIAVTMSESGRAVSLLSGQAFFSVSADPERPFTVSAGSAVVTVLGTRFDVHMQKSAVRIGVEEGIVNVAYAGSIAVDDTSQTSQLVAGEQLAVVADRGLGNIENGRAGQWRTGRMSYVDSALSDVVGDMSRYRPGNIVLSTGVAELRLTAAFRVAEIENMLDTLEIMLPVEVSRVGEDDVLIKKRYE